MCRADLFHLFRTNGIVFRTNDAHIFQTHHHPTVLLFAAKDSWLVFKDSNFQSCKNFRCVIFLFRLILLFSVKKGKKEKKIETNHDED